MRAVSTPEALAPRVEKLEIEVGKLSANMTGLVGDVGEVKSGMGSMATKVDQLVTALSSTDGKAAERAQAVKHEMREETDRKARDRSTLLKDGIAVAGFVALLVGAFCGPYLNKINATSDGQADNTRAIAAVRELLAQESAETARNHDAIDIARDKNRRQDDQLVGIDERLSHLEGERPAR